jgi:hypothetical protein
MRVYFDGLKGREIEFVVAAAERLMRADLFPKLADWHREAVKVEAERVEEQRALLRKLPSPLCLACSDTGWRHAGHGRVHPCDCLKLRARSARPATDADVTGRSAAERRRGVTTTRSC